MDDWDEDAYGAIYDEHDRERKNKVSNTQSKPCFGILTVFVLIGLILLII